MTSSLPLVLDRQPLIHLNAGHRKKHSLFVKVDGEASPQSLHRKKYEAASCGWYYRQTLKSVQIKYPNHPKKDHAILISFAVFDMICM